MFSASAFASPRKASEYGGKISERSAEIQKLERQLNRIRGQRRTIDAQEKDTQEKITEVTREIEITGKMLRKLDENKILLLREIEKIKTMLQEEEVTYYSLTEKLNAFIRNMYILSRQRGDATVIDFRDIRASRRALVYYRHYFEYGKELLRDVDVKKKSLTEKETQLNESYAQLEETLQKAAKRGTELRGLKDERRRHVASLRNQRRQLDSELSELEKEKKAIETIIATLERRRLAALDTERRKVVTPPITRGAFAMPARGKIVRRFGPFTDPVYRTQLDSRGINIRADSDEVVAAADGVIAKVGYFRNLKNFIIIEHPGGIYTFYSRLEGVSVLENDRVTRGSVIGDVEGSEDRIVHFEVRKGREAVDPMKYLQ